jgi:nucleoside-diphosphate-sugar epimerase
MLWPPTTSGWSRPGPHCLSSGLSSGVSDWRLASSNFSVMPVIVIGADSPLGEWITSRLAAPDREVRAFVSSPAAGARLKQSGIKVAIGDLSDEGHIGAACTHCFGAVMIEEALRDGRELAFASPDRAASGWVAAAAEARITRVIWVGGNPPVFSSPQSAVVSVEGRSASEVADEVAYLDDLAQLPI